MAQKDYPELEGTPVIIQQEDVTVKARVDGCNYDVGLTISIVEEHIGMPIGTDIICLNGPSSPHWDERERKAYSADFYSTVRGIKKGVVSIDMLIKLAAAAHMPACGATGPLSCGFKA